MKMMWDIKTQKIFHAIEPVLHNLEYIQWVDVAWYVGLCANKGFANTSDQMRLCAERYVSGKRKVSAPWTRKNKKIKKERDQQLRNVPHEILDAVNIVCSGNLGQQYKAGNTKVINAMVGQVMKVKKIDAAVVMQLLKTQLEK
jgi:hypothetical protein